MHQKTIYVLIAVLALSALGIWLWLARGRDVWAAGWGQGQLKVSERAYYVGRIGAVIDTWRSIAQRAKRNPRDGRIEDSDYTCLVINAAKRRIWIETNGRILAEYETDLPPQMEWTLHRSTPDGGAELASLSRFRIPGIYRDRLPLEQIFLVGTRGKQEHLHFSFTPSGSCGNGYGSGPWNMQTQWKSQATPGEEAYESIVVGDESYERIQARFSTSDPGPTEPAVFQEARAAWTRVEKRLYQEIERQVSMQGRQLQDLKLACGPDYTAASAELRAGRSGPLGALRGGPAVGHAYLQIDCLGNDVWYAQSVPHPQHPMPAQLTLDLEFLTAATGRIAKGTRQGLLAEGRQKQQQMQSQPPSKWLANLPNGAVVEFVGLCWNPSGGRPWWGPDGSPLGFVPYVNYEQYAREQQDRTVYEILSRVHLPPHTSVSTRSAMEGTIGSYSSEIRDRYGNRTYTQVGSVGHAFKKSMRKTTLTVGVRVNEGEFAWVTFKNISLVPGEDQAFEIVQGQGSPE